MFDPQKTNIKLKFEIKKFNLSNINIYSKNNPLENILDLF